MLDDALNLNEKKESTYYRDLATLESLSLIYNTPLQSATEMQIKDFMLKQINYSQSTINKQFQMLKATFREAVRRGIIVKSPMEDMEKPKSRAVKEKVRALTIEEQQRLYEILMTEDVNYSPQMLLSMLTGMRMGEINALEVKDVNMRFNTIYVCKTISRGEKGAPTLSASAKTDAGTRTISMNNRVKAILRDCIQDKKKGLIFTRKGKLISTTQVNSQYLRLIKKYQFIDPSVPGRVDLHSLRHTYATRCIESGIQPKVLQKLLGHTDISITLNTYCDAFEAFTKTNIDMANRYMDAILDGSKNDTEPIWQDV